MSGASPSGKPASRAGAWPWLRERLLPRGTDMIRWAAFVVVITMMVLAVLQPPDGISSFQFNSTVLFLAVLLVIVILWDDLAGRFKNRETGDWALLGLSTALTFYVIIVGRLFMGIYILFMLMAMANAMVPARPALGFSVLLAGSYMGLMILFGTSGEAILSLGISILIGTTFVITLSQVLNRYIQQSERMNALLEQLQEANLALVEAKEKEKELAIAEERLRMARELHDGLGHHLTALSIQLQAAEKLVDSSPRTAAEAVSSARGEVRAALKEVRQSVAVLREAPVALDRLPEAIEALANEVGRNSGLRASFSQHGEAIPLSPAAALTLWRTAQEGLTNVQKHAYQASQVRVALDYAPGEARLSIEDDGRPRPEPPEHPASGFGLAGLRERASLLGGWLECGPRDGGGFRLAIALPATAPAGEDA